MAKEIYKRGEHPNSHWKKGNHTKTEFKKGMIYPSQFKKGHSQINKGRGCFQKGNQSGNRLGKITSQQGFQKGLIPWNKDKKGLFKHTKEWKENASERMTGPKHWNYQGGISFELYGIEFNSRLKRQIRERDNYTDQLSGGYGNCVHHIDYDKKNNHPSNLITLSRNSNARVNYNREDWMEYFNNKAL